LKKLLYEAVSITNLEDCDIWKATFQNILITGRWEKDDQWGINSLLI